MDKALQMISQHAEDGAKLRRDFFAVHGGKVAEAARRMAVAVARGGKILLAGNGGSAADAQHWAAEFVNRFLMDRPPLPAIALTTDSSVLTSIGNDFGYDLVFTNGLTGDGGGRMAPLCDILLAVGHPSTPLVQETHAAIGHMLCALTDYYLFENVMAIKPMLD